MRIDEFLLARLGEKAQRARDAVAAFQGHEWGAAYTHLEPAGYREITTDSGETVVTARREVPTEAVVSHIVFFDPAWVLREVEARKGLIASFKAADARWKDEPDREDLKYHAAGLHDALVYLAQPYKGHRDFDPRWASL